MSSENKQGATQSFLSRLGDGRVFDLKPRGPGNLGHTIVIGQTSRGKSLVHEYSALRLSDAEVGAILGQSGARQEAPKN
ncbi:hypothetical protein [Paraburkholderia sp. J8-2]|uniref:hypothetical protein n=1 Tax=Paraburkholderia sp. J8-2 TaxID=2805440 RepID=UPI002AB5E3D1|nr:hypothetical protein [Paraburkholderia sp. J8-2]